MLTPYNVRYNVCLHITMFVYSVCLHIIRLLDTMKYLKYNEILHIQSCY